MSLTITHTTVASDPQSPLLTNTDWNASHTVSGTLGFDALASATNTSAAMVVGTGGSIAASGSGTITATAIAVGGVTGLGTGVATFLATPTSANLAAAITNETGSGSLVFATSPALVTPDLGTPSALVGTNITGTAASLTSGVASAVTVANEATDSTCFIAFWTAVSGSLPGKSNTNMTFDSSTGIATFASTVLTTTDINGGTVDGAVIGGSSAAAITGTTITGTVVTGNSFVPNANTVPSNGMYLPAANTLGWGINSAAELQLTATALSPAADGGNSLGTTALGWQNLFGNTGFVFNIENSDWVATHTTGILTVGTGDLRVTTAGSNSASVVTVGGTQTLTNKTLTSPTLTTPSAFTTGGNITLAENTSILQDAALSADGKYTAIFAEAGTLGETVAFGEFVYLKAADSQWYKTDADADSTAGAVKVGCCVLAGNDNDPTTIMYIGKVRADSLFPTLTIGAPVYLSTTAGAVQVAQPSGTDDVIRIVGYGNTADEMHVNVSNDYITHT